MEIDIQRESVIPFQEATTRIPGHSTVSLQTLHRWRKVGVVGPAGERIKLETARLSGRRCTSLEAISRFFERQNAPAVIMVAETASSFEKRQQAVEATLGELGVGPKATNRKGPSLAKRHLTK